MIVAPRPLSLSGRRQAWDRKYSTAHPLWRGPSTAAFEAGPGKMILELGCGDGKTLRSLLATGATVVALDFSAKAVRCCRGWLAPGAFVHLLQAQVGRLPFAPRSFDLVVAHHILEHLYLEERRALATEALRVLSPGGSLSFRSFSQEDMRFGKGEEVEERTFLRDGVLHHYFSSEEVRQLFQGFEMPDMIPIRSEMKLFKGESHVRSTIELVLFKPRDRAQSNNG